MFSNKRTIGFRNLSDRILALSGKIKLKSPFLASSAAIITHLLRHL
jgi:hypothetical protein